MSRISEPIICISTRLEAIANRYVFSPMGTSSTSIKILGLLQKKKSLTPKEIMDQIGGTKSNISQRLSNLEKNGLIERTYALFSDDKRKISIKLTAKGQAKLAQVMKRLKKANISLESHFSEKEIKDFNKFLNKIQAILDSKECSLKEVFID